MNRNITTFDRDQTAINISRSKQNLSHGYKSTFNAGFLYPLWSNPDVLPGDTFKVSLSSVIRMSTPVAPILDDCYADVYVFFTPHKMTMQRYVQPDISASYSWKYFMGAQDYFLNMPYPGDTLPKLPIIGNSEDRDTGNNIAVGSFYERLGVPPMFLPNPDGGVGGLYIHALDWLAYACVWNDFFRDENTEQPVAFGFDNFLDAGAVAHVYGGPYSYSDDSVYEINTKNGSTALSVDDASILPVSRPHGYFGSALPFPQRSAEGVTIPLLGAAVVESDGALKLSGVTAGGAAVNGLDFLVNLGSNLSPEYSTNAGVFNPAGNESVKAYSPLSYGSGLKVDLSDVSSVTVNQFRALVAKQHYLEALARGGNRLGEMTSSLFGVRPHDSGDEHSEYLGGVRIPITVSEVAQTMSSDGKGLGLLGAYSKTVDRSYLAEKSFDTWGTLSVYICFRTAESFTNGIARRLTRRTREDLYYPAFARIGDMPVLNKEIYATDSADGIAANDEVYGYVPAWSEYRYEPNLVTGLLRPDQNLGYFTFANNFNQLPTLKGYLEGGDGIKANVDRTLQVSSETSGFQFIGDFWFDVEAVRPLPADTRPGLTRI